MTSEGTQATEGPWSLRPISLTVSLSLPQGSHDGCVEEGLKGSSSTSVARKNQFGKKNHRISEHEYNGHQFMVGDGSDRGHRRNRTSVIIAFLTNATWLLSLLFH